MFDISDIEDYMSGRRDSSRLTPRDVFPDSVFTHDRTVPEPIMARIKALCPELVLKWDARDRMWVAFTKQHGQLVLEDWLSGDSVIDELFIQKLIRQDRQKRSHKDWYQDQMNESEQRTRRQNLSRADACRQIAKEYRNALLIGHRQFAMGA